jgi:hypothetical protein
LSQSRRSYCQKRSSKHQIPSTVKTKDILRTMAEYNKIKEIVDNNQKSIEDEKVAEEK